MLTHTLSLPIFFYTFQQHYIFISTEIIQRPWKNLNVYSLAYTDSLDLQCRTRSHCVLITQLSIQVFVTASYYILLHLILLSILLQRKFKFNDLSLYESLGGYARATCSF